MTNMQNCHSNLNCSLRHLGSRPSLTKIHAISSIPLQIERVMAFWKANFNAHPPSKIQVHAIFPASVIARRSCSSSKLRQLTFLHQNHHHLFNSAPIQSSLSLLECQLEGASALQISSCFVKSFSHGVSSKSAVSFWPKILSFSPHFPSVLTMPPFSPIFLKKNKWPTRQIAYNSTLPPCPPWSSSFLPLSFYTHTFSPNTQERGGRSKSERERAPNPNSTITLTN